MEIKIQMGKIIKIGLFLLSRHFLNNLQNHVGEHNFAKYSFPAYKSCLQKKTLKNKKGTFHKDTNYLNANKLCLTRDCWEIRFITSFRGSRPSCEARQFRRPEVMIEHIPKSSRC